MSVSLSILYFRGGNLMILDCNNNTNNEDKTNETKNEMQETTNHENETSVTKNEMKETTNYANETNDTISQVNETDEANETDETTPVEPKREEKNVYIVSSKTLALLPIQKEKGVHTLVIEEQKEEVIRRSPFEVIKDSLRVYGSSYEEAVKMSQENLIIQQKLPICVRTIQEIIPISVFFPTESPTVNSNAWISLEAFSGYNVQKDGQLRIYLSDSQNISLDISNTTLCRQITHSKVLFKKATDLFTSVHSEPTNFVKKQSALWLINHLLQGVK